MIQAENDNAVGFEDGMMIVSKLFQSSEDFIRRSSYDEIYGEINLQLDGLIWRDLTCFEQIDEFDGDMNTFLLEKLLKDRRGMAQSVTTITPRVNGVPLTDPTAEWWRVMKVFVVAWSEERGEGNGGHSILTAMMTFNSWRST